MSVREEVGLVYESQTFEGWVEESHPVHLLVPVPVQEHGVGVAERSGEVVCPSGHLIVVVSPMIRWEVLTGPGGLIYLTREDLGGDAADRS